MKTISVIKKILIFLSILILAMFMVILALINYKPNPDFNVIFEEVMGFEYSNKYVVLNSDNESNFMVNFITREGEYTIRFSDEDFSSLVLMIEGSKLWKLQPASRLSRANSYREWEKLVKIDRLSLIAGAHVMDNSQVIKIFYFEQ